MHARSIVPLIARVKRFGLAVWLALAAYPADADASTQTAPLTVKCPTDIVLVICETNSVVTYPPPIIAGGCANPIVTCTPPSGAVLPSGVHTVDCRVVDDCTNRAGCTFTITLRRDLTDPVITCPSNLVVFTCQPNGTTVFYQRPTATDNNDTNLTIVCQPPAGSLFPYGDTTVTCEAIDDCDNRDRCSFVVSVRRDTKPPVLTCPTNLLAWACDSNGVAVFYSLPAVTDDRDANPLVVCLPPPGTVFPIGITAVNCEAVDDCDNHSECGFTITVRRDLEPPVIDCPRDIVQCVTNGKVVVYMTSATDNGTATPTIVCHPPSGSQFELGTTVVLCRAVDLCGNEARCEFKVTLVEDKIPSLTISKDGGYLIICWPKTCLCFQLQATRSLNTPIAWTDVADTPLDVGDGYCVRVPNDGRMRFFRLIQCDRKVATVYRITSGALTANAAAKLADALDIPPDKLMLEAGAALFLEPRGFQAIPTMPVLDPAVIDTLARETENDGGDLAFEALNLPLLRAIRPVAPEHAIERFARGLAAADLLPAHGDPSVAHTMFDAVDTLGQPLVEETRIDTHVIYNLALGGIPVIGPGAQIRMAFSPSGDPTALLYASREVEPAAEIALIPVEEAARRCARLYPELKAAGLPQLMYFAPPLGLRTAQLLVPCYECGGDAPVGGENVQLLRAIIPATDDPTLAPQLVLNAMADGTLITAQAVVSGGAAPYTYEWVSSSVDLSALPPNAASVEYRAAPRGGEMTETLRVYVTDANGVPVQAYQTFVVPEGAGAAGGGGGVMVSGVADFGTERAVSDMGAANQSGFNSRLMSAGIHRRFNFSGVGPWERDFKEGPTGLDHVYADNVDITFYIGHGNGGGFTFESEHDDDKLTFSDAAGAWGDGDMEWLALLSCEVLKDSHGGKKWNQRWGPAFNGLHLLLGFETVANDWSKFGGTFADWTFGRANILPPMPIATSWFLAKAEQQPASRIAVAIGVIGPGDCSNYGDFFWGRGTVGPDIRGNNIKGYWRVRFQ